MNSFHRSTLVLLFLSCCATALVTGQSAIPDSNLTFLVERTAMIPDSSAGQPARVNVVTEDPSGTLFANDQRGPLYQIDEVSGTATEFLDLRDYAELALVSTSEAGFQSFAFHPDFPSHGAPGFGRFYTLLSSGNTNPAPDFDPGGTTSFHSVLLEWRTEDPNAAVFTPADSANPYRELMRFKQPFGNHNGGLIAFHTAVAATDPDRNNLYLALGDGGSAGDPQNNGQNLANPFGALLRIDPLGNDSKNGRYGIVAANKFASDNDARTLGEIFCYGLRNPQRFGWDLSTGEGYLADIGQGGFEEINRLENGANFGWNKREGAGGGEEFTNPIATYAHNTGFPAPAVTTGSRAVTTGDVMRGTRVSGLEGALLASDFPTGRVFRLFVDDPDLNGGSAGFSEIRFRESSGARSTFLDLINIARQERGLSSASRADLRISLNTPGRVILSNKADGILRSIVPDHAATLTLTSQNTLRYAGLLETSTGLKSWHIQKPQPTQNAPIVSDEGRRFYRAR